MRFRLRTLLIVLSVGPVVLAGGYWAADWLNEDPLPSGNYKGSGLFVTFRGNSTFA